MSLPFRRRADVPRPPHERARMLAARRLDEALAPADAEWLTRHLRECGACAAIAETCCLERAVTICIDRGKRCGQVLVFRCLSLADRAILVRIELIELLIGALHVFVAARDGARGEHRTSQQR